MPTIKVFTVEEMVAAEQAADAAGLSYAQMMENAGRSLAQAIVERFELRGMQILILVGPGNNGGDGLVAGRYLAEAGAEVAFYLYLPREAAEDENFARIVEMGLFHVNAEFDQRYRVLRLRVRATDMIIDALLGTGVDRPIGGELAKLMQQVQAGLQERREEEAAADAGAKSAGTRLTSLATTRRDASPDRAGARAAQRPIVIAVDSPSGLNCNIGALDPLAFPADLTVTFAGPKRGHFIFPGAAAVGELVVADIGIDSDLPAVKQVAVQLATAELAREMLPPRPIDGHKGTFGKVLVVAGSAHYWGAPLLCGRGAYRAGTGLVALAVPEVVRPIAAGQLPEAIYPPAPDAENFSADGARFIEKLLPEYDALLVGPGLGVQADDFMQALLDAAHALPPLVVDADGLNSLARLDDWPQRLPPGSVLTPHPGEMARLVGVELSVLQGQDRVQLARDRAAQWQHVVLLKGAFTVVAAHDGRCTILPFANPLLSSAGSGDVLSGVIVALLGQGLGGYEAAILGAYLHGAAGELAREELGDAGLLSGELADWLPKVQRLLRTKS